MPCVQHSTLLKFSDLSQKVKAIPPPNRHQFRQPNNLFRLDETHKFFRHRFAPLHRRVRIMNETKDQANLELEPTSERAALQAPRAAERGPGRARARGAHRAPPSGTASRRSFSRLSASPLPHSGRLGPQFGVPWTDASVWKMPFSCWPSSTPFSILEIITSTRKFVFGSLQSKEQYVA